MYDVMATAASSIQTTGRPRKKKNPNAAGDRSRSKVIGFLWLFMATHSGDMKDNESGQGRLAV